MSAQGCPKCGYPNPAGNHFCQSCGNPLPAAVAAAPPTGAQPAPGPFGGPQPTQAWGPASATGATAPAWPQPPAPGPAQPTPPYQTPPAAPTGQYPPPPGTPFEVPPPPAGQYTPYYNPGGVPPPVSRTSPGLLIGVAALALVAVVVVALGGFLVVRAVAGHPQSNNPTPAPINAPGGGGGGNGGGGNGGGGTGGAVSISTLSLDPGQFQVSNKTDTEVDLQGDPGGLAVAAGRSSTATTTQDELSRIQQQLQSQYGDLETCVQSTSFTIGGKSGTLVGWRYDDTDSSGNQTTVCDAYWVDAQPNGNLYEYEQVGADDTWNSDLEPAAKPVRDSIKWLI